MKIEKLTVEKLSDILAQLTKEYTTMYFSEFHKDMDRQNWAALHLGFVTALKQVGYEEKELDKVLDRTKKLLTDFR